MDNIGRLEPDAKCRDGSQLSLIIRTPVSKVLDLQYLRLLDRPGAVPQSAELNPSVTFHGEAAMEVQ